jgi:hypothetical protein
VDTAFGADRRREGPGEEHVAETETEKDERPRKQVYLRTVYPLNPGIPHYVDNPDGW